MSENLTGEAGRGPGEGRRVTLEECASRMAEAAELAARVRHEVNNPLTGLIGQTQLLLREDLSPTARRRVQTIEQLAERIRDTVAELRQVQPIQAEAAPSGGEATEPPRH